MLHTPTKEDLERIYSILGQTNAEDTSYAKTTVLGWFKYRNPLVEVGDDYALFCGTGTNNTSLYWAPIALNEQALKKAISILEGYGAKTIFNVNEYQKELYESLGYTLTPSRDYFEYLYLPENLIELKGKKYHSKRNFINGFTIPYEFRSYEESDREKLNELLFKWSYLHIDNGVDYSNEEGWHLHEIREKILNDPEIKTLNAVLDDIDGYNCFADVLTIEDGKIIGFALGEILPSGIGAIYFEKGDVEYKGVYPLLDNAFCKKHFSSGVRYINKQEDMGLEGLRKSKLSYYPVKFAERHTATKE